MPLLDFAQRQKVSKGFRQPIMFVVNIGLVLAVLSLGSTLASNIRINSGALEFGQGVAHVVTCSGEDFVTITPRSKFINDVQDESFKFNTIELTHIPASCWGKRFLFQAYDSEGSLLEINTTDTSVAVDYLGSSTRSSSGLIKNASGENSSGNYGKIELEITAPSANAKDVYRIVVQSSIAPIFGLVASWDFNDSTALGDSSYGDFNLQYCGTPTGGSGLDGTGGLSLDGSSYLASSSANYVTGAPCTLNSTVTIPEVLLGNATYSKSAWFKIEGRYSNGGIMAWGDQGCGNTTSLRLAGFGGFSEYWWDCDAVVNVAGPSFDDNQWHFVVSTYDGTNRKIYYDGQLILTETPGVTPDFKPIQFLIGATIFDQPFSGNLDKVAVYSVALSDSEVTSLYQNHG